MEADAYSPARNIFAALRGSPKILFDFDSGSVRLEGISADYPRVAESYGAAAYHVAKMLLQSHILQPQCLRDSVDTMLACQCRLGRMALAANGVIAQALWPPEIACLRIGSPKAGRVDCVFSLLFEEVSGD